ncbi:hypothetical protein OE88DRAFT_1733419, partial [Heliocybe sulcata]
HTTRRVELWKVLAAMLADASKREAFVDTALDVIRKGKYQAASENPNILFASAPTTHPYPYSPVDDDAVIRHLALCGFPVEGPDSGEVREWANIRLGFLEIGRA